MSDGIFTFDVTLSARVEVVADSLSEAVQALQEMHGENPYLTLFRGGHGTVDLNEISLGPLGGGATIQLAHLRDGDQVDIPIDGMAEPVVCEQYQQGTQVERCEVVYDETCGDGYCGTCAACADAGLGEP